MSISNTTKPLCCNQFLQIISLLATIFVISGFVIFIVASRCCIKEPCSCSKITKRRYDEIGIPNLIGYFLYFSAWLFYFQEDVLVFCRGWTLVETRILNICFFTASFLFLTLSNLFLLSLFSEKDKHDEKYLSDV
jgi:hypothetical protein